MLRATPTPLPVRLLIRRRPALGVVVLFVAVSGCANPVDESARTRDLALASAATSAAGGIGAAAAPVAPVQQALNKLVAAGIPGAALYMRDTNGNVATLTAGDGIKASHTPMDPDGLMMLASITKSYVATVAVQLAAQGVLSLDDKVDRWLPGALPYGKSITLRQLLQHTAGVPVGEEQPSLYPYWGLTWGSCIKTGYCWWKPIDILHAFDGLRQAFPAGTKYQYSSNGYDVAGLVLEAATGQKLGALIQQRIVQPLGLQHSTFPDDWTQTPPGIVHGYADISGSSAVEDVHGLLPIATWAEGAMFASVGDVAKFYDALLSGRIVPPNWVAEMQKFTTMTQGYGLGIYRSKRNGRWWWGHSGRTLGFESIAWYDQSTGASIVLIHNASWYPNSAKVNTAWYAVEREANKWIK